ncbi:MAG TPA: hypothetical protein VNH44_12715 [Micropepsaceae bacterium]|nr:hypothetical protein [Micropepsaceae bacterium]
MSHFARVVKVVAISLGLFAAMPAMARQWNANAQGAAVDYSQIIDSKANGEFVFVWWPVPEAFPNDANSQVVRNVLARYVFIGIARGRSGAPGLSFYAINDVKILDGTRELTALAGNTIPPEVTQTLTALQAIQHPLRQGIRWFVFESSAIHACTSGKLSVPFEGTTYTFDTPIPGCAK